MTKPLTLFAMALLTVIALGVGYMAMNTASSNSAKHDAEIQECARRHVDSGDVMAACLGR